MIGPPVACLRSPGTPPWLLAHFSIAGTCITAALAILAQEAGRPTNASPMKGLPAIATVERISVWRDRIRQPGAAFTPFRKAWLTSRLEAGTGFTSSALPCTRWALASMLLPTAGSGSPKIWRIDGHLEIRPPVSGREKCPDCHAFAQRRISLACRRDPSLRSEPALERSEGMT